MTIEITAENIHTKTDHEILKVIGCFGVMWNPWDPACNAAGRECAAQARCLHHLAVLALPQDAAEQGLVESDHVAGRIIPQLHLLNINELAAEKQTDPRAIAYAIQYSANPTLGHPRLAGGGQSLVPSMSGPPKMGGAVEAPKVVPPPPPAEPSTPDDLDKTLDKIAAEAEPVQKSEEPAVEKKTRKPRAKKTEAAPSPAEASAETSPAPAPKEEAPAAPVVRKKGGRPKKIVAESAAPAPEVEPVTDPTPAPPKESEAAKFQPVQDSKFVHRFQKESEKLGLPVGAKVEKSYRGGSNYSATKTETHWDFEGLHYATLTEVQKVIEMREKSLSEEDYKATMSVSRFWGL